MSEIRIRRSPKKLPRFAAVEPGLTPLEAHEAKLRSFVSDFPYAARFATQLACGPSF
jgi:hypothetical protein